MSTKTKERELKTLAIADLVVVDGHNPRGTFSTKDDPFKELVASIKDHGVLQAILVGPADADGHHPIIAGHRRYAAAKAAKLKEIPAMVADLNGSGFSAAIAENLIRQDMTPLQEARAIARLREQLGLKQAEVAKALGKSERWTRDREQLLAFPAALQKAIDKGEIPLEAGKTLAPIAKASPKAVEKLVAAAKRAGDEMRLADKNVAGLFLAEIAKGAGLQVIHGTYGDTPVAALPVSPAAKKELKAAFDQLPKHPWQHRAGFRFNSTDAKAAKEKGVLLEFTLKRWERTESIQFITDPEFVAERARKKLPGMKREIEKATRSDGTTKAQREAIKKEAEAEEAEAAAVNEALGEKLSAFAPKATDVDVMRVICAMALGERHNLVSNVANGLGAIAPEFNGSDGTPGAAVLLEQLAEAKTSNEQVRLVLQMAIAAKFTRDTGWTSLSGPPGVDQMLEDVAEAAGVLPQLVLDEIELRRQLPTRTLELLLGVEKGGLDAWGIADKLDAERQEVVPVLGDLVAEGKVTKAGNVYVAAKEPAAA